MRPARPGTRGRRDPLRPVPIVPERPPLPPRSPPGGRGRSDSPRGGGPFDDGGGVNALIDNDGDDSESDCDGDDGSSSSGELFSPRAQVAVAEAVNQPQHEVPTGHGRPETVTGVKTGRSTPPRRVHSASSAGGRPDVTRREGRQGRSRSSPVRPTRNRKPTYLELARAGYQELVNAIIRPPRSKYALEALGPEEFTFCGADFERRDFGVVNERGLLLECSMWRRKDEEEEEEEECVEAFLEDDREGGGDVPGNSPGASCPTRMTLNVDGWDETRERGKMHLHVPDGFDGADDGLSSSSSSSDSSAEGRDDGEGRGEEKVVDHCGEELPANYYSSVVLDDGAMLSPRKNGRRMRRDPVVIYLHGNSSARNEVVPQLGHLLSLGVSVVSFDFAGSGRSEGDLVSLGYFEREDLQSVVTHLRRSGGVGPVALWGRSMGAATALMYGSRDPTISGMVLDSCFTDLRRLAEEMVARGKEQGVNVPGFVVTVALKMIKNSIKAQAGFNIKRLCPAEHAGRCFVPAMFVAGDHDDFIGRHHSEALHERYAGDKNIMVVDGDHNSPRPRFCLQSACLFLRSCMRLSPDRELVATPGTNLMAPPWFAPGNVSRSRLYASLLAAAGNGRGGGRRTQRRDRRGSGVSNVSPLRIGAGGGPDGDGRDGDGRDGDGVDRDLRRIQSSPSRLHRRGGGTEDDVAAMTKAFSRDADSSYAGEDGEEGREREEDVEAAALAAAAPPDMSERQREIQSSLFKMLGQEDG